MGPARACGVRSNQPSGNPPGCSGMVAQAVGERATHIGCDTDAGCAKLRAPGMALPRPVRHRCDLLGRLDRQGDDPVQVRVVDLSENGAFIEEAPGLEDMQVGDEAELVVALPGGFWNAGVLVTRIGTTRVDVTH